jgi:hypothetical protein
MQPGFNENVLHNGLIYHVQTEDGGSKTTVITTTLFNDGAIVTTKRSNYSDMVNEEGLAGRVVEMMREQHAGVISELQAGRYDSVPQKQPENVQQTPSGESQEGTPLASDGEKGLDEIILDYLSMGGKK